MLKIIDLSNLALKIFKVNKNEIVLASNNRVNKMVMNLFNNNKSRNLAYMPNIKAIKKSIFLILGIKKAFNYLKQVFIKFLIS